VHVPHDARPSPDPDRAATRQSLSRTLFWRRIDPPRIRSVRLIPQHTTTCVRVEFSHTRDAKNACRPADRRYIPHHSVVQRHYQLRGLQTRVALNAIPAATSNRPCCRPGTMERAPLRHWWPNFGIQNKCCTRPKPTRIPPHDYWLNAFEIVFRRMAQHRELLRHVPICALTGCHARELESQDGSWYHIRHLRSHPNCDASKHCQHRRSPYRRKGAAGDSHPRAIYTI
jgi:hypothetical protein